MQLALQEDDAEQADEKHQGATGHLVYRGSDEQQPAIHERRAQNVADGREREQQNTPALERLIAREVVFVVVVVAVGVEGGCRVNTTRIGMIVEVGIGVRGGDGLVVRASASILGDVALPQGHEGHDEPAAGLADEHLGGLDHGLLKKLVGLGIGVIAVANALVILLNSTGPVSMPLRWFKLSRSAHLVLGEERIAHSSEEHHSHKEGYRSLIRHDGCLR